MNTRVLLGVLSTVLVIGLMTGATACSKVGGIGGGNSPYTAADHGNIKAISKALQAGFQVNKPDSSGMTLLHHAAIHNQGRLIEWLVKEKNASTSIRDKHGRTPLEEAMAHHKRHSVQALRRLQ